MSTSSERDKHKKSKEKNLSPQNSNNLSSKKKSDKTKESSASTKTGKRPSAIILEEDDFDLVSPSSDDEPLSSSSEPLKSYPKQSMTEASKKSETKINNQRQEMSSDESSSENELLSIPKTNKKREGRFGGEDGSTKKKKSIKQVSVDSDQPLSNSEQSITKDSVKSETERDDLEGNKKIPSKLVAQTDNNNRMLSMSEGKQEISAQPGPLWKLKIDHKEEKHISEDDSIAFVEPYLPENMKPALRRIYDSSYGVYVPSETWNQLINNTHDVYTIQDDNSRSDYAAAFKETFERLHISWTCKEGTNHQQIRAAISQHYGSTIIGFSPPIVKPAEKANFAFFYVKKSDAAKILEKSKLTLGIQLPKAIRLVDCVIQKAKEKC